MGETTDALISKEETRTIVRGLEDTEDVACIIFGAGASFGYTTAVDWQPPVVKDLFNTENSVVREVLLRDEHKLLRHNRQHIVDEMAHHDNDLEAYLSSLYHRNSRDKLFSALVLYLEDVYLFSSAKFVAEPNNYKKLINLMWELHGDKRWACITFNYDTLLEQSFITADRDPSDRSFTNLESFTDLNPAVLKMHGGVNIRYAHTQGSHYGDEKRIVAPFTLFASMMSNASGLDTGVAKITYPGDDKPPHHSFGRSDNNNAVSFYDFPLMLIPVHATVGPENPYFEKALVLAEETVKKAKTIISIGYNFGDKAFVDRLSKINFEGKDIILVGTKRAAEDLPSNIAYKRARETCRGARIRVFDGDGFGEFVQAI